MGKDPDRANKKRRMVWFRTRTVTYIEMFPVTASEEEINSRDSFDELGLDRIEPVVVTVDDRRTYCSAKRYGTLKSAAIRNFLLEKGVSHTEIREKIDGE